jgi:hypothetical protein
VFSARGAYKASGYGNPRTRLSRLGPVESLVLEYALRVAEAFTPSDVAVYAAGKYSVRLDRRRVHDAVQRLVKRGVLVRAKRGWYRLSESVDMPPGELEAKRSREVVVEYSRSDRKDGEWGPMGFVRVLGVGVVGCGVVRVHGFACDLVSLCFQVAYSYYVLGLVLRGLESRLRGLGYSGCFVKRVRGVARRLALSVAGCEAVVGGHGRYGCESRQLVPLSYSEQVKMREIGVDILAHRELPKIHVKIYTTSSPYATVPLTTWSSRRVR